MVVIEATLVTPLLQISCMLANGLGTIDRPTSSDPRGECFLELGVLVEMMLLLLLVVVVVVVVVVLRFFFFGDTILAFGGGCCCCCCCV